MNDQMFGEVSGGFYDYDTIVTRIERYDIQFYMNFQWYMYGNVLSKGAFNNFNQNNNYAVGTCIRKNHCV